MTAILEIITPHGEHRYHTIGSEPLCIGRAFDCDIILNDEYLSARHLTVRLSEAGHIRVADAGSENGTVAEAPDGTRTAIDQEVAVVYESRLLVGKTTLILHAVDTAVPPAKKLHIRGHWLSNFVHKHSWALQLLTLILLGGSLTYLEHNIQNNGAELVGAVIAITLGVAMWAAFWAFIGKVLAHHGHFFKHAGIFSGVLCLGILIDLIHDIVIYSMESIDPSQLSPYRFITPLTGIAYILLSMALLAKHLGLATQLRRRARWLVATLLPVCAMSAVLLINHLAEDGPDSHRVEGDLMLPLAMRLSTIKSARDYVNGLDALEKLAIAEDKKAKD